MEDKKFDPNSLIGFILMGMILMWMFYNQSKNAKIEQAKKETEQRVADSIQKVNAVNTKVIDTITIENSNLETPIEVAVNSTDSVARVQAQSRLGAFAYSTSLNSAKDDTTTIENDVLKIVVSNKGGQIQEVLIKEHKTYDMKPLYLVKDHNANLQIDFSTQDNRVLSTKDMYFEPTLTENSGHSVLSMKLKVDENRFLEYRYTLKPTDYMIDFDVRSQGLNNVIDSSKPIDLTWDMKTFHTEKSIKYENQYTTLEYSDAEEFDYLNATAKAKDEDIESVNWIAFRQQFFTSILNTNTPIEKMNIKSENLVQDEEIDTLFTKHFTAVIPLKTKGGEFNYNWNYYYGPSDYNILKTYEGRDFERSINMGWGIFRWINKYFVIPVFNALKGSIASFGLIIILMTIVIRLLMSPLVYKSYLSSAKMKVLRPEMEEVNKRLPGKENAMKRQQETMAIQNKAGVSMLSGCIPALLQMPVFFALFRFFPSWFDLRQKGFLWANDLSAYDNVLDLPFKIPVYGAHVSLFPLLASIAIFFYMQMSQSQQANMQPPAQEGMPDMQKMMKIMLYISPVMMLFFFNQYGSGLSLYYFISNVLTLTIMYVIKTWVIDETKVHAMVEKKKAQAPKKKSAFRQRIDSAMKQAQAQQELQKKGKKK